MRKNKKRDDSLAVIAEVITIIRDIVAIVAALIAILR